MTGDRTHPRRTGPLAWVLIQPIRGYQRFISRYTPPSCRYYPTCSNFGIEALRVHGAGKGLLLTAWRLLRCNPWSSGGIDHVPEPGRWRGRRDVVDDPSEGSASGFVIPESRRAARNARGISSPSLPGSTAA